MAIHKFSVHYYIGVFHYKVPKKTVKKITIGLVQRIYTLKSMSFRTSRGSKEHSSEEKTYKTGIAAKQNV